MDIKRYVEIMLMFAVSAGLFSSCGDSVDDGEVPEIYLDAETRSAAENLGKFYIEFTKMAARYAFEEEITRNIIVSPLSAALHISMVANATDELKRKEILDLLGVDDLKSLNNLSSQLMSQLPTVDKKVRCSLANSAWINSAHNSVIHDGYRNILEKAYLASINNINFKTDNIVQRINDWIYTKSDKHFSDYFTDVDPE